MNPPTALQDDVQITCCQWQITYGSHSYQSNVLAFIAAYLAFGFGMMTFGVSNFNPEKSCPPNDYFSCKAGHVFCLGLSSFMTLVVSICALCFFGFGIRAVEKDKEKPFLENTV